MSWLRTVWSEFVGLFVVDGSFAVAILVWLAVAGLGLPRLALPHSVPPVILSAGLVAILVASAARRSRANRDP